MSEDPFVAELLEMMAKPIRKQTEAWLARDEAALAGVLPRCSPVVAVRGEGSWLWDVDGKKYLDLTSGIGVTNTGHCHPRVVEAITHQAGLLLHTSVTTHHTLNVRLAERLGGICPFFDSPQVFFCNSGAEAADGSLKLARKATGNPGVIAFQGAFHGRTVAATALTTAKKKYWAGYQTFPGVFHAPYGGDLPAVESILMMESPPYYRVGAVIVEPVLGEGGYIVPPLEWLQGLRDICTRAGLLLIFDEVQCGMGRTGYPFAAETFGVRPDILLFAKGVASGLPLGGIIAERSLMEQWPVGTHGSTFGGNPVACAAALATLDVLESCYQNVREMGAAALERLSWTLPYPVRGIGLMIGIELPSKEFAEAVQERCLQAGVLVLLCGSEDNVIRLIPPLTISYEELSGGISVIEQSISGDRGR